jgi:thioredoxin-dependent peroxiredoxin
MRQLGIGDTIPDFQLEDQYGNMFNISSVRGKKKLVLFFYPQDGSLNCTKEACYFRDLTEAFDETGAVVLGISGQSVESHKAFAEANRLNYLILSDGDNKVRKLFGVPSNIFGLVPGRVTYIVDDSGKVRHIFNSQTDVSGHVDEALKICLLLKKTEFSTSGS